MKTVWGERRRRRWTGVGGGLAVFALTAAAFAVVARAAFTGQISLGRFVVLLQAIAGANRNLNFGSDSLNVAYGAAAVPAANDLHRRVAALPSQLRGQGDAEG